jgi:hypothetical protein
MTTKTEEKAKPKRYKDVVREQTLEKMKGGWNDAIANPPTTRMPPVQQFLKPKTSRLTYDANRGYAVPFLNMLAMSLASDDDSDDGNLMVRKGSGGKTTDVDDEETRQQLMQEMDKFGESAARQVKR